MLVDLKIILFLLFIAGCCLSVAEDKPNTRQDMTKIKAGKKRLKVLVSKMSKNANDYFTHIYSDEAAMKANVYHGNSNYEAWKNKYAERYRTNANAHRHKLVSKLLQDNTQVSQAIYQRAEQLKEKTEEIDGQMKTLKDTGKHDPKLYPTHSKEYLKKDRKHVRKNMKFRDEADEVYYFLDANGKKKFVRRVYNDIILL